MEDIHSVATEALMAAVAKGIMCENGVYRFYDPGISLVVLHDLPIIREKNLFRVYSSCWYDDPWDWAKQVDAPQERIMRVPVENSFGKIFAEQLTLLTPEEEVASARSIVMLLVISALVTKGDHRIIPLGNRVRCSYTDSVSDRVTFGWCSDPQGVLLGWYCDGRYHSNVGLAACQKARTLLS